MEALDQFGTPKFLQKLIASYFTDRILQYDTDNGLKVYRDTGGVSQGSVRGRFYGSSCTTADLS